VTSSSEFRKCLVLGAAAALCLLGARVLEAQEPVRVEVEWVESDAAMDAKRREFGAVRPDNVIRTKLTGFSVLGKRDGELVCLIFAPKPRTEDDKNTLVLGHELAHCLLGSYHQ
jgi:hypothetical protein